MTNKLTIKQITDAAQSFMCQVFNADLPNDVAPFVTIQGSESRIVQAITSLIEAATFDANIECGKSIERQKYWRNRSVEANTELSEAWGDYAAMKTERDELRQQLKAAQNDVKQLRAARDKRKPECVRATASGIYDRRTAEMQVDGSVLLRDPVTGKAWTADGVRVERKTVTAQDAISEVMAAMREDEGAPQPKRSQDQGSFLAGLDIGAIMDREFEKVRAACRKNEESINDGWIECKYLPIKQWCDVRRADGTTDRVCRPEVRGMQQDAEITHYRPVKKEAKPKQDDGWIEWHGDSTPPIKNGIAHQVKFLCGEVSDIDYAANTWAWGRKSGVGSYTIVAYRLAK